MTASFLKESGVEVNRPEKAKKDVDNKKKSILVVIDESDQIWIAQRPIDIRAVRANIDKERANEDSTGDVVIRANKDSSNGILVRVVDAARQAGAKNVSLLPSSS